jgi:hypothetical protein
MTDPEREHLLQQIGILERSRGRWRLAALVCLAVFALPLVFCGTLGLFLGRQVEMERMHATQAMEEARRARDEAEEQRRLAVVERQRAEALLNVQKEKDRAGP